MSMAVLVTMIRKTIGELQDQVIKVIRSSIQCICLVDFGISLTFHGASQDVLVVTGDSHHQLLHNSERKSADSFSLNTFPLPPKSNTTSKNSEGG